MHPVLATFPNIDEVAEPRWIERSGLRPGGGRLSRQRCVQASRGKRGSGQLRISRACRSSILYGRTGVRSFLAPPPVIAFPGTGAWDFFSGLSPFKRPDDAKFRVHGGGGRRESARPRPVAGNGVSLHRAFPNRSLGTRGWMKLRIPCGKAAKVNSSRSVLPVPAAAAKRKTPSSHRCVLPLRDPRLRPPPGFPSGP